MRHANKINKLSRKTAHRKAMFENMSCSLIMNKRIFTTVAKAKALRRYLEPVVTKAKNNDTHNRRTVYSYLGSNITGKAASKELFDVIAPKIGDRPGGYLRIIKTGFRPGDNAEMAMIEFVDFNEVYTQSDDSKGGKKRSRRAGKKKKTTPVAETKVAETVEETVAEVVEEPEVEAPAEEINSEENSATEEAEDAGAEAEGEEPKAE